MKYIKNTHVFPTPIAGGDNSVVDALSAADVSNFDPGLTKRELFAIHALNGMLSDGKSHYLDKEVLVKKAIKFGDTLLKELNDEK